jgi:hypothetical protein
MNGSASFTLLPYLYGFVIEMILGTGCDRRPRRRPGQGAMREPYGEVMREIADDDAMSAEMKLAGQESKKQ